VGKDTARNIRHRSEFVINVVNESLGEAMNVTAIDFPPETNELDREARDGPFGESQCARIAAAPAPLNVRNTRPWISPVPGYPRSRRRKSQKEVQKLLKSSRIADGPDGVPASAYRQQNFLNASQLSL
jgi:hypothetical protein